MDGSASALIVREYRKKPVVIEAIQLDRDNISFVADWCRGIIASEKIENGVVGDMGIIISTLEGDMRGSMGDYIIQGVDGEFYPCKPGIFEQTYEPVV